MDGPYQINPPSPDDIKLLVQIERRDVVYRIRHEQEIVVEDNQILTCEITDIMKHRQYNLAYFIAKRMKFFTKQDWLILPYVAITTKPNCEALRKCILKGPYKLSTVTIPCQPATDESPAVEEQIVLETFSNITPKNKAHYDAEKEAIHLILTRIGDDIYSTIDACKTDHEMWIAIKRLQQGESINKQDVKTSLFWEFGRFTSRYGESIESY
ncbi:hypothetical protein Tco_0401726 [Tanacetum coccineum]